MVIFRAPVKLKNRPSFLRSSGSRAIPAAIASAGERRRRARPRKRISPPVSGSIPNRARAISLRPEPSIPPSPHRPATWRCRGDPAPPVVGRDVANLEQRPANGSVRPLVMFLNVFADHPPDDRVHLERCLAGGADDATVAHDGDGIRKPHH